MRTILITGAAGGVGAALVGRALRRGDTVIAAVRSLQDPTLSGGWGGLHRIVMDVADSASVTRGFAEADAALAGRPLDAVIHCAAIAPLGTVEFTAPETLLHVLNVNTVGTARIIQGAAPRLRGRDGRLILLTSLWGRLSGPMVSSYAASKHAIEALADAARREFGAAGPRISVIEPGVIRTNMLDAQEAEAALRAETLPADEAALYGPLYASYRALVAKAGRSAMSAEDCARAIERVLVSRDPPARVRVGLDARMLCALRGLVSDRLLDRVFALTLPAAGGKPRRA